MIFSKKIDPKLHAAASDQFFTSFLLYLHSSNSGVEKYLSAVSGSTVTTVFPSPSFFASFRAAATFVPDEIPHMIPSFAARSRDVWIAYSSVTMQISS